MMSQVPSLDISIAEHTMTVIAVDGSDVEPKEVSSFTIYAGERYDVVMCANARKATHAITATYSDGCNSNVLALRPGAPKAPTCVFRADLVYAKANTNKKVHYQKWTAAPKAVPHLDLAARAGHAMLTPLTKRSLPAKADAQFTLDMGYMESTFNGSMYLHDTKTPWTYPKTPLLHTKGGSCGAENVPVINVPEGATNIELVINNLTPEKHQVHLHGPRFSVIEVGEYDWCSGNNLNSCLQMTSSNASSVCSNVKRSCDKIGGQWWGCAYSGSTAQNLDSPLVKDTISVPRRGYVVLRVETTTPGVWMLQTQATTDQLRGAQTALNVMPSKQQRVPASIPTEGPCKPTLSF